MQTGAEVSMSTRAQVHHVRELMGTSSSTQDE